MQKLYCRCCWFLLGGLLWLGGRPAVLRIAAAGPAAGPPQVAGPPLVVAPQASPERRPSGPNLASADVAQADLAVPAGIASARPALSPEARQLYEYFASIYGKQTLLGQNLFAEAAKIENLTGKTPALVAVDLSGWHKVRWSDRYRKNLLQGITDLRAHHDRGGIASLQWHWANPLSVAGTFAATKKKHLPIDVGRVVTPGTDEHRRAMAELRLKADYLEVLCKARVPVVWRPLHEIDGGWFWWTDTDRPENSAALWRMMFQYLTVERKLDNLLWVYSAASKAGDRGQDVEAIDYRRRFYPGDEYVDLVGIDIYVNSWYGWEDYRVDSYPKAKKILHQIAPRKMSALTECEGIPQPSLIAQQQTQWLYCMAWYVGRKGWNPPTWVAHCYADEQQFLTLEDLPRWADQEATSDSARGRSAAEQSSAAPSLSPRRGGATKPSSKALAARLGHPPFPIVGGQQDLQRIFHRYCAGVVLQSLGIDAFRMGARLIVVRQAKLGGTNACRPSYRLDEPYQFAGDHFHILATEDLEQDSEAVLHALLCRGRESALSEAARIVKQSRRQRGRGCQAVRNTVVRRQVVGEGMADRGKAAIDCLPGQMGSKAKPPLRPAVSLHHSLMEIGNG
jgi:mannan endo-1,4-beta-mannosidase